MKNPLRKAACRPKIRITPPGKSHRAAAQIWVDDQLRGVLVQRAGIWAFFEIGPTGQDRLKKTFKKFSQARGYAREYFQGETKPDDR